MATESEHPVPVMIPAALFDDLRAWLATRGLALRWNVGHDGHTLWTVTGALEGQEQ